MSCGCNKAKSVVAATRVRDARLRGGPLVTDSSGCTDPQHAEVLARLADRVLARPGLRLRRRLVCCGAVVTVE